MGCQFILSEAAFDGDLNGRVFHYAQCIYIYNSRTAIEIHIISGKPSTQMQKD